MKQYSFGLCLILIFLLGSCANIQDSKINLRLDKSNCFQEFYYDYGGRSNSAAGIYFGNSRVAEKQFSKTSLNIANVIGILDLLERYILSLEVFYADPTLEK